MGDRTQGVGGGPAGFVWHGAPPSAVPDAWGQQVRAARREFEEAIDEALARAPQVAVVLVHTEALSDVASTDPLTGLLNRRGLQARVESMEGRYAVALVDVDDFKSVNTALGLAGGDEVLKEVARVLSEGRADDVVARWGGEEFLLVLPAASADDASGRLQRMLAATDGRVLAGGKRVTFSCGIATGDAAESFDSVVATADARLRQAKRAGKARVLSG